jgi:hypothetical protein
MMKKFPFVYQIVCRVACVHEVWHGYARLKCATASVMATHASVTGILARIENVDLKVSTDIFFSSL